MAAGTRLQATTVGTVKAAATAALRLALPGPLPGVTYGFPGEVDMAAEMVFLGDVESDDEWSELGRGAREERYTIDLLFYVRRDGGTQQEATDRALALLALADAALTAQPLLPPPFWCRVSLRSLQEEQSSSARACRVLAGLRCYARL